jgi:hypothetical protein
VDESRASHIISLENCLKEATKKCAELEKQLAFSNEQYSKLVDNMVARQIAPDNTFICVKCGDEVHIIGVNDFKSEEV